MKRSSVSSSAVRRVALREAALLSALWGALVAAQSIYWVPWLVGLGDEGGRRRSKETFAADAGFREEAPSTSAHTSR